MINDYNKTSMVGEGVQSINPEADHHGLLEFVSGRLIQLESLVAIMNMDDFWEIDRIVLRNYILVIQELITQSLEATEILFNKSHEFGHDY